jgi:hypothetical protein
MELIMSRTYRQTKPDNNHYRNPHTQNERRQLEGLKTDARLHQVNISPANRLSRHIPTDFDDLKVSSFAETFFDD